VLPITLGHLLKSKRQLVAQPVLATRIAQRHVGRLIAIVRQPLEHLRTVAGQHFDHGVKLPGHVDQHVGL
jgi:hypothetical protein